ncbi:1,4-dihydroxy-2-naphthoyl-CoA thioesterase 1 [Solanum pennellii]|uniref:1,4-dihydroxy-2-naphthoyl-CoA thioesterase 1 n=1 Tax=Solanum pennellii TaxID=28526 RepID=A0ABM1FZR5_SOLPN|nr:1,4-dihydroxy-2-naphthoyl-CoA thioesterase 1 [Solanum pennellii]
MGPSSSSGVKAKVLDIPLHGIGFEFVEITPHKITGRLPVTDKCCQPFKVLHGGVSALMAESLASMGAHMASGFQRVAGVHLSIHHLKSAHLGDLVFAEAVPINIGKSIHVWEVCLWKIDPANEEKKTLLASSRVTLKVNMSIPENAKDAAVNLKKYAKL